MLIVYRRKRVATCTIKTIFVLTINSVLYELLSLQQLDSILQLKQK